MDITKTFSNPLVIAAGVGLGLVIMLRSGSGNAPSSGSYVAPEYLSTMAALNAASTQAVTEQYNANLALAAKQSDNDVAKQLGYFSLIQSMDNNDAALSAQITQSHAGIVQTQITTSAAVLMDQIENAARTTQTYIQADAAKAISNNNVTIAQTQAKAAKKAATMNLVGQALGLAATVATAGMAAPAMAAAGAAAAAGSAGAAGSLTAAGLTLV